MIASWACALLTSCRRQVTMQHSAATGTLGTGQICGGRPKVHLWMQISWCVWPAAATATATSVMCSVEAAGLCSCTRCSMRCCRVRVANVKLCIVLTTTLSSVYFVLRVFPQGVLSASDELGRLRCMRIMVELVRSAAALCPAALAAAFPDLVMKLSRCATCAQRTVLCTPVL